MIEKCFKEAVTVKGWNGPPAKRLQTKQYIASVEGTAFLVAVRAGSLKDLKSGEKFDVSGDLAKIMAENLQGRGLSLRCSFAEFVEFGQGFGDIEDQGNAEVEVIFIKNDSFTPTFK